MAAALANRAQELDPLSLPISATRGLIVENGRRFKEATEGGCDNEEVLVYHF